MKRQMSRFAMTRGTKEPVSGGADDANEPMPDMDDPRVMRAMSELERDMEHMDENNPRHMAHMMKKMKGHHAARFDPEGTRCRDQASRGR
jgi:uncharacterized protein involved in copper resistance